MTEDREILEGTVVDLACVRRYPRGELAARARRHSRDCVLMGHCMESGYALVDEAGGLAVLDAAATPLVIDAVAATVADTGIRLRAVRERHEDGMRTVEVTAVQ